jgi:hypothetical protein
MDLTEQVLGWTMGRFRLVFVMETPHPPAERYLDSLILEYMYEGIEKDVGRTEALNFVRFVTLLNDLCPVAFSIFFREFANGKFQNPDIGRQIWRHLSFFGRDYGKACDELARIAYQPKGMRRDQVVVRSLELKEEFLRRHITSHGKLRKIK